MHLLDLARVVEEQKDIDAIWMALQEGLRPHGFDHLIYITVDADFENPCLLTTLPRLFDIAPPCEDPFLHWCCDSYVPTLTGAEFLDDHDYLPEAARTFILRARDEGFLSGLGLPVRLTGSGRFGGFNLGTGMTRDRFRAQILPKVDNLSLLCLLAHRRIEEVSGGFHTPEKGFRSLLVAPGDPLDGLSLLTPREREVLFLIARGMSRKECARLCNISINTVSEYAKKAYRKLGLRNRAEAAALFGTRKDLAG